MSKELSQIIFSRVVWEVFHEQVAPLFGSLELGRFVLNSFDSFRLLHTGRHVKWLVSPRQKLAIHFLIGLFSAPRTVLSVLLVIVAETDEINVTLFSLLGEM